MISKSRKGRGNKSTNNRFEGVSAETLRPETALIGVASSKSSITNKKRAARLLSEFAQKVGAEDPVSVTIESSKLVLNLISVYCKVGTPDAQSDDSVGALVQGLRAVYEEAGHRAAWNVNIVEGKASGNPLTGNDDVKKLRAAHRVHLSQSDRSKFRPRPLNLGHVCEHATRFWLGNGGEIDQRDVLLHAIMIVGLNLGLRYDEVHKVQISHVTVNPGINGTGSILLSITEALKNSTKPREYLLREWPGNTKMRSAVIVDPFIALLTWMCIRGNRAGYLFCTVTDKNIVRANESWPVPTFTAFFRDRLRMCGVGPGDVRMYSGHSIKRGAVQLYRSLGLRDEQVMEIVQMTGANAYANYCAAYNDCGPSDIPRFNNIDDFLRHADTVQKEQNSTSLK